MGSKGKILLRIRRLFSAYTIEILTVVALLVMGIFFDGFLCLDGILNIMKSASLKGVLALGMTVLMVSGHMDLSVGSTAAFAGVLFGGILEGLGRAPWAILPAFVAVIAMAVCVASLNTWATIHMGIPSLMSTFAVSKIVYALCGLCATLQFKRQFFPAWFKNMVGQKWFGVLPGAIGIFAVFAAIFGLVLAKSQFGRNIYTVGGNLESAKLSGIKTTWVQYLAFLVVQLSAVMSGLMLCGYQGSASHNYAQDWPLDVICSAIIGGAAIKGGYGSIKGTCLGLFFVGLMNNALIYLKADAFAQYFLSGVLMISVAVLNDHNQKEGARQKLARPY